MKQEPPSAPWWKHGFVWLVIAGPVLVVLAALVTLWLAAASPDPVLATNHDRRAVARDAGERALMPAVQGRNHAATPAQER